MLVVVKHTFPRHRAGGDVYSLSYKSLMTPFPLRHGLAADRAQIKSELCRAFQMIKFVLQATIGAHPG